MPFEQFIPRPLTAVAVHAWAPTASGIFGVSNAREWLYIGETDNIQGTLLGLLQTADTSLMKMQPTGFVFEVCEQARRLTRQNRLVFEYEPACNRRGLGVS